MVAVCGSYLFACGKTSNVQSYQNNLSLQAIWLEVNWSMTDQIYSVSRWLIFFCCCIWHKLIVLVSLLNRMFAFMLHSEYTTCCFMEKYVIWHNFQSPSNKQARQIFHCFVLNSHFIQPSECKYVPFVSLGQTASILHSLTLAAKLILEGKSSCATLLRFSRKRIKIIFRGRCRPWKLKSAKNNPHVF